MMQLNEGQVICIMDDIGLDCLLPTEKVSFKQVQHLLLRARLNQHRNAEVVIIKFSDWNNNAIPGKLFRIYNEGNYYEAKQYALKMMYMLNTVKEVNEKC